RIWRDFTAALTFKKRQRYPVHLKIDTGMHRLGFMPEEMNELLDSLKNNETVEVKSVFSHLAGSEDSQLDSFTRQQVQEFVNQTEKIEKAVGYKFLRHIANTSAISRHPDAQFDMVRLGIG